MDIYEKVVRKYVQAHYPDAEPLKLIETCTYKGARYFLFDTPGKTERVFWGITPRGKLLTLNPAFDLHFLENRRNVIKHERKT